jgi:hypothetical protein
MEVVRALLHHPAMGLGGGGEEEVAGSIEPSFELHLVCSCIMRMCKGDDAGRIV